MNIQLATKRPKPVKLTADGFLLLESRRAFSDGGKVERRNEALGERIEAVAIEGLAVETKGLTQ